MEDKNTIREKVVKALNRVRPYLQNDGGDIDLIEITDDMTVKGKAHRCMPRLSLCNADA